MSHLTQFPAALFARQDETPDAEFYSFVRLVTHIDAAAIAAVTQLYREYFEPGGAILDLMSSWVSHLPDSVHYRRVAGLGMNARELKANPRLSDFVVHDLNADPQLPYANDEFDGAAICVSIDYLTQPVVVLAELGRVLRPGAPLVATYSNRCFPTKAVAIWLQLSGAARGELVAQLIAESAVFGPAEVFDRSPAGTDPLFGVVARARQPPSA
ncbi:MAG: methyltransferase domain-containing protein [Immundisolibacter sp.]|uniref:methyltransferase domain-containing protein n=1 Tax=Immundisolibacter sp. TaxID=1934948 RepID=UPI003EE282AE